jgi:hypothetical protein
MKKLVILGLIAASSLTATAQKSNAAQVIYDELEQNDDVFTLSFNKKMIDAIDTDVEWGDELRYLKGDLEKVQIMLIDDGKDANKMSKYIYNKLDKLGYKLADLPKDGKKGEHENVWLFTNKKGKKFTEAHFLIQDTDGGAILLSVYGDITVTDEKL